jgi:hypothetical protein
MARRSSPTGKSEQKTAPKQKPLFTQPTLHKAGDHGSMSRILQYGWDFLAVVLIAGALILLFALLGITTGALVSPLKAFLTRWFGWGRFLLVAIMLTIAFQVIQWRKQLPDKINLGNILTLELAIFIFLALLSIAGHGSVTDASAGYDPGGIIGWGIAEIFRLSVGPTAGFVLLLILFAFSLIAALRILPLLERFVRNKLQQPSVWEMSLGFWKLQKIQLLLLGKNRKKKKPRNLTKNRFIYLRNFGRLLIHLSWMMKNQISP